MEKLIKNLLEFCISFAAAGIVLKLLEVTKSGGDIPPVVVIGLAVMVTHAVFTSWE